MSVTAAAAVVLFCVVVDLEVLGGMLAGLAAGVLGIVVATTMVRRAQLRLRPRIASSYLRPALSFGVRAQLANVLAYSSARIDLLFVYALASHHDAGLYSVALTLGTITGFVAIALSFASFPSMAAMTDPDAFELTATLGDAYAGALAPTIVLLFANVLWGVQWLLSRALAARGDPALLVRSFSANLAAMAAADAVLIPLAGAVGAAVGALIAAIVGLGVCLRTYDRRGVHAESFVPRRADLVRVWTVLVRGSRGLRRDG
jgi:O-antigen/teichoic acid export membrane protein